MKLLKENGLKTLFSKKIILSLFMAMVLCLSAMPALSVDNCDLEDYYEEDEIINFNGVLVDVKDIDPIDNRVILKFIESGYTYDMNIGHVALRDGISVKLLDIAVQTSGAEQKAHLCFNSAEECTNKVYHAEDQQFYFGGVLLEIKDIDLADNRIDLKFLETGITYDMDIGHVAEREGISVKLLAILDSGTEPSALLCMNEVEEEVFTPPFIIAVGDNAPAADVMTATKLSNELKDAGHEIPTGSVKLFSEVNAYSASSKVITAIYKDEAVIIVGDTAPASYVVFAVEIANILKVKGIPSTTILVSELESSDLIDLFETTQSCTGQGYKCTSAIRGCGHYEHMNYLDSTCGSTGVVCCEEIPYCGDGVCFTHELPGYGETSETCPKDCGSSCTDSDGGRNYYVKGKVTTSDEQEWDFCEGNYLYELTCDEAGGKAYKYLCPNGCRDGVCLQTSQQIKPDLEIENIEIERATVGSVPAYRYIVYTKNTGSVNAPKSNLHVEISPKQPQAIDDGARYNCMGLVNFPMPMNDIAPGPELRAGESERATEYFNPSESGYITITATVDPYEVVDESNEGNNVMSKRFYVQALVSEEHSCIDDEEPIEIVAEEVKCIFYGSTEQQKCYTGEPNGWSCKGTTSCEIDIEGKVGDKITWKSTCGGYAYTRIDGNDEYIKFDCSDDEVEVPTCTDGVWNDGETGVDCGGPCPPCVETPTTCQIGCLSDSTCLPFGTRMVDNNGIPVFCHLTKTFDKQKQDGELCQNSYECLSNSCHNSVCISLEKELRETRGMLQNILDWLRSLFG